MEIGQKNNVLAYCVGHKICNIGVVTVRPGETDFATFTLRRRIV